MSLDVGGDLNIASLQDTKKSQTLNLSAGTGSSGSKAGLNIEKEKYKSVGTQTSLTSGGTLTINTKNNTNLVGVKVTSKEEADITTGTLTFSDLKNETSYSKMGADYSTIKDGKSGIDAPMGQDKNTKTNTALSKNIKVNITNKENQKQDIANISTDTKSSHYKLIEVNKEVLNIRKDVAGEVGKEAFKFVAHTIYDNNPELEKYVPKTVVHGIVGGIVSQIAGGSFANGATGAVVAHEVAKKVVNDYVKDKIASGEPINEEELKARTRLASTIATAIVASASGGSLSDVAQSSSVGRSVVDNR